MIENMFEMGLPAIGGLLSVDDVFEAARIKDTELARMMLEEEADRCGSSTETIRFVKVIESVNADELSAYLKREALLPLRLYQLLPLAFMDLKDFKLRFEAVFAFGSYRPNGSVPGVFLAKTLEAALESERFIQKNDIRYKEAISAARGGRSITAAFFSRYTSRGFIFAIKGS